MTIAQEDSPDSQHDDEVKLTLPDEQQLSVDGVDNGLPKLAKNYHIGAEITRPMTDKEKDIYEGVSIPVLPDQPSAVNELMENSSSVNEMDVVEQSMEWYQGLVNGFKAHPSHGIFEDAMSDPKAHWTNALKFNEVGINIGRPNFRNKGRGDSQMSSERLVLSVRSRMGLGAPMQLPLTGSGFYVTHKPLEEDEIIALWREIIAENIKLGRVTHGMIFANNQVLAAQAVVAAWLATVLETTVSDMNMEDITKNISINDLPLIYQSVATAIYPNGFPISRSVFSENTGRPKEQVSQIIDIRKALFINEAAISDDQQMHMTKRFGRTMTMKSVKEYTSGFDFRQETIIDVGNDVKLHLHTPSVHEYFECGEKWVREVITTVNEALGKDADTAERVRYISQLAKATRLRQYAHYVKAIEEDGELYTTRENVDKTLSSLSASPEVSKTMFKAISEYINKTQIAIVATTSVNKYEDTLSGEKWPRLIPIDCLSVFFQLVEQKLLGIVSRQLEAT